MKVFSLQRLPNIHVVDDRKNHHLEFNWLARDFLFWEYDLRQKTDYPQKYSFPYI